MAEYTANYALKKPTAEDFYEVQDQNDNMDVIDGVLENKADLDEGGKIPPTQLPDIDCGFFAVSSLEGHAESAFAHQFMSIDGNANGAVSGKTLAQHETDPMAHPNLSIDGNIE